MMAGAMSLAAEGYMEEGLNSTTAEFGRVAEAATLSTRWVENKEGLEVCLAGSIHGPVEMTMGAWACWAGSIRGSVGLAAAVACDPNPEVYCEEVSIP